MRTDNFDHELPHISEVNPGSPLGQQG